MVSKSQKHRVEQASTHHLTKTAIKTQEQIFSQLKSKSEEKTFRINNFKSIAAKVPQF